MIINNTETNFSPIQGIIPAFLTDYLAIDDPVVVFDEIMKGIDLEGYVKPLEKRYGRPSYNSVRMLKTILFGFMEEGYVSLRKLEDQCRVNIRYKYLMGFEMPSYRTFGHFIKKYLEDNVEALFQMINAEIFKRDNVDLEHIYIDGSKFEANANKYTWVWKKSAVKSRDKVFGQVTEFLKILNETELNAFGVKIQTREEYAPEYLEAMAAQYLSYFGVDVSSFTKGKGKRKTQVQRNYERLMEYARKLKKYRKQIATCGDYRNSYSKTDPDATFMRMKRDYMKNDQLLPAYNVQIGVADEYIAVVDAQQFASDMDCFVPLMEQFNRYYGHYPKYPVADAGYGSFNNYLYCQEHGMEKYMKFPTFKKETKDKKYRENPYRVENFPINEAGELLCPEGRTMEFLKRQAIRGNKYGREEEIYVCKDCSNCPHADKCKKGEGNRTVRLNAELTSIHQEVLNNLKSEEGIRLRTNRSIQAEGTFGIMKHDRWYKRMVRRSMKSVKAELFLVSIGHNLYKYYNKHYANPEELLEIA